LLIRNPNKRLGSGSRGAEEIKEHPFFKNIDWDKVQKKGYRVPPPHIRHVASDETFA